MLSNDCQNNRATYENFHSFIVSKCEEYMYYVTIFSEIFKIFFRIKSLFIIRSNKICPTLPRLETSNATMSFLDQRLLSLLRRITTGNVSFLLFSFFSIFFSCRFNLFTSCAGMTCHARREFFRPKIAIFSQF